MTLDRAWARRPLVSPPPFGRSVPDIWAETEVTFYRRGRIENDIGGFKGTAEQTIATVYASVSIATDSGLHIGLTAGPVRRRYYLVIVDVAKFATLPERPRKGDLMRFIDPRTGVLIDTPINTADLPEGISDHYEIESEIFE